jgi:tryptophanyl-tRNA synthetase
VLQAADILLYRADMVPVGEDQVQHLELSRVISRRWNASFGRLTGRRTADGGEEREEFFPEPKPLLTPTRRIMGLDGQTKMSKSMGNTVALLESPDSIWAKLRPAVTDPKRIKRTDPGTPEVCNIYHLHKAFSPVATVEHVATQCTTAGWGCIDCKKVLAESMETELVPIRARAAALEAKPDLVNDALSAGAAKCRRLARETMDVVRDRMGF